MRLKFLLLTCFAAILTLGAAANVTDPGTGEENLKKSNDVVGAVYHNDSKKPLGNVSVTAYSTLSSKKEKVVVTDANGNFSFNDLKPGSYKLVFEKSGFKKVTKEKFISREDEAFQINVHMEEHKSFDFMPGSSQFFDF
jgi:uncharacterized protein (DUF2141 family)